jgi:hypothetical protein
MDHQPRTQRQNPHQPNLSYRAPNCQRHPIRRRAPSRPSAAVTCEYWSVKNATATTTSALATFAVLLGSLLLFVQIEHRFGGNAMFFLAVPAIATVAATNAMSRDSHRWWRAGVWIGVALSVMFVVYHALFVYTLPPFFTD